VAGRVVIGIPTFRRPGSLRRLLESVARLETRREPIVVVADNEGPGGEGGRVAGEMAAAGYRFALRTIPVPARGIANVRNALMDEAFDGINAGFLAMVDDDEIVEPNWLDALLTMAERTGADIVGGAVRPMFETPAPAWTDGVWLYWRKVLPPGPAGPRFGTTNIVLARSLLEISPGCRFDAGFFAGEDDTEFLLRVRGHGAMFAFAPDAVSHEVFGPSRLTRRWALQRAFRFGNGYVTILRAHQTPAGVWAVTAVRSLGGFVVGLLLAPLAATGGRGSMRGALMLAQQVGKVWGLFGGSFNEYRRTHGG
jgi:glycosyltransferase involved in cell wall biosynthesis